tara:strand:+ start:1093 stop:2253 length:1161 start_codon:yes stop_codon:yes gene_type:complete
MADRDLIQGAAVLAQAEGNMSRALGAGITQEATRIADDIIKRENERIAQVKNDMNVAAQFIGKMASTGTAAGQYRDILTQEGINTKNRLNEIALDNSLNAVEKAAAYTQAVDEYNTLASTYGADQEKLVNLQGVVRSGNYSNTINRDTEEFKIARALGTGDYKIVKDGYIVNGKKIKSQELDQYIGLYEPKNVAAFSEFDTGFRNNITKARGNKNEERALINTAASLPVEQKLKYLVNYKEQAYNNYIVDGEISEALVNDAYLTELKKMQEESSVPPVVDNKQARINALNTNLRNIDNIKIATKPMPLVGENLSASPLQFTNLPGNISFNTEGEGDDALYYFTIPGKNNIYISPNLSEARIKDLLKGAYNQEALSLGININYNNLP